MLGLLLLITRIIAVVVPVAAFIFLVEVVLLPVPTKATLFGWLTPPGEVSGYVVL